MRILLSVCIAVCSLHGQTGQIARPSLGYVFDPAAHALRRIQGIPGAALVGSSVDFGFPVSAAYVSPHLDSAFVVTGDGVAHLFQLSEDAPRERAVGPLGSPSEVVFSPSGSAAALCSPGSVQIIKGLPGAPAVAATVSLPATPRTRQRTDSPAVSDDGAYLLYAGGGSVTLIGAAGDSRRVMPGGPGTLAAFAPGGHDAAVVDQAKLTLFQDVAGAATVRTFDGIGAPGAVAFSPDAQKLFVASSNGRTVTGIQVATGSRTSLACDCAPSMLLPMGSVFRLTELGSGPIWLLDAASDRGLLFVPAPSRD